MTDQVVSQIEEVRRRRNADLVLELDLTEPLVEATPQHPVSAMLARRRPVLHSLLDGLRQAARDPRVRALVVKLGGSRPALATATAQELRDAVAELRHYGTHTVAWAESFGELGKGSIPYVLATAFDEVWLQPSGDIGLTGLAVEVPFLRAALDKAGITPQVARRHEYKNALDIFTEQSFTAAHREATEHLVHAVTEQLVDAIADARNLAAEDVRRLMDRAPLFAAEALDAGLVDHLGYRDQVYASVRERVGEGAVVQYFGRYVRARRAARSRRVPRPPRQTVALVPVTGPIHMGRSGRQPFTRASAGSDTVTAALRAAARAKDVQAIVLRVASPGGSYVASDAIWRAVTMAREAGTPVVASMGDVAASGGYFVSMGADVVVAEPATITGSIGVVTGKPVVESLADRMGVAHEGIAGSRSALMFSLLRDFSEDDWGRLNAWLDRVYDDFVAKVADARGLPSEQVHEVARGRVWTGADAKDHGLLDELGGLHTALEIAKDRAGLPPAAEPELRVYPRTTLAARLRPATSSEEAASPSPASLGHEAWGAFADLAAALRLPAYGPLTLAPDTRLS